AQLFKTDPRSHCGSEGFVFAGNKFSITASEFNKAPQAHRPLNMPASEKKLIFIYKICQNRYKHYYFLYPLRLKASIRVKSKKHKNSGSYIFFN
ncbi:hypothetical protein, partial [Turicimonas muris]|uniref:hypothetical protein n=1 Tax=Turicimonas muris TaxID=1796652 RepID=UPI00248BC58F